MDDEQAMAEREKECEELRIEKHHEFLRWLSVAGLCGAMLILLCVLSPMFQPTMDPNGFTAKVLWSVGLILLAILGLTSSASAINWITPHDWWHEIKVGNIAAAIVVASLFVAIGLALSSIL